MPALKLTTDLLVLKRLDEEYVQIFTENTVGDKLYPRLLELLSAENARDQIERLKKVTQDLNTQCKKEDGLAAVELPLKFLVHLFFISTSKNPVRRVLISNFQGFAANVRCSVIGPAIKEALLNICSQPVRSQDGNIECPISYSDSLELRHNVDSLLAVLENFILGEECVHAVSLDILSYLGDVQECFVGAYGDWLSPVQQNEIMHHCLETVKLANRVCQKSYVTVAAQLEDSKTMERFTNLTLKLIVLDMRVLKMEEFLIDCKTTSSMNIWLMLKFSLDQTCFLQLMSSSIFKHISWLQSSCDLRNKSDLLPQLEIDQLQKACLSNSSYLCLCYGFLVMSPMELLLLSNDGKCLLLDALLGELISLSKSCSDVGSKLLAAKSVSFLSQKLREFCCDERRIPPDLITRLQGDSEDMKILLDFVWTAWEDSVDAIRFTVREIFENIVAIHLKTSQATVVDDPFLHKLTVSILNDVSWSCKGKYPTLSVLVTHLGSAKILQLHPDIAEDVLEQMQEHTLACYASELYEKLFSSHTKDVKRGSEWFSQWLVPVLSVLCDGSVLQKKHTIEYVLPKVLKTGPGSLNYIINTLTDQGKSATSNSERKTGQLGALIMCLRRARVFGLLKSGAEVESGKKWCGHVDVQLLEQALMCKDEQIRLDAFALLCENQKTSELIDDIEIQLVRSFVPQNLNNQNPAFRQHFLSLLKKFLSRMKESQTALKRKVSKDPALCRHLQLYQELLCWLTGLMFGNIYPGSVFARRTTCLGVLSVIKEIFGTAVSESDYNIFSVMLEPDVNALLFCLTDTFEDNKSEAASLLIGWSKSNSPISFNESTVKELFETSLLLSQSTRPQDSTTAAYLFSVLKHQPCLLNILKKHIEDIKIAENRKVLDDSGLKNQQATKSEMEDCRSELMLMCTVKEANESIRDTQNVNTESVSAIGSSGNEKNFSGLPREMLNYVGELDRSFLLLIVLMNNLEKQAEIAKQSLIVAAANNPLYPTIQCMRYCLHEVNFRNIPGKDHHSWKLLLTNVLNVCCKIASVVSPVVCNSSPEGNVPIESISGMDTFELNSDENLSKSHETVMLMPEYLIVCCWRSVKEISLVLGQLTASVPIEEPGLEGGLLSFEQVIKIGEFFTVLLLESKHRGAFELAYAGFVKVTDMLWRSSTPELHQLPKKWLLEVMQDIKSNDPDSRLCATRRSAGLPFYVQALATSEPTSTGRQCFKETMRELLALALDETIVTQDKCNAKVHALNILRSLYKDSRLKDDVAPFVADGLKVAILGFKSPLWAVRNSATLLMTAMMTRIFGVKRSKDETTFSRKNCQTGRTFFYNFPTLYQFLLEQIAMATENVSSQLHPGLYPILMVLGRLFPSSMEGTDTSLNLAAFIPFVIRCNANPVLKTRVMAAKALHPLVEKNHVTSVVRDLVALLPNKESEVMKQNQIHGVLLQLAQLSKTVPLLPTSVQAQLAEIIKELWTERVEWLITRHNRCLLTRKEALELSHIFMIQLDLQESMLSILSQVLSEEMFDMDTEYASCTPSLAEFQCTVIQIYCDINIVGKTGLKCDVCVNCEKNTGEDHLISKKRHSSFTKKDIDNIVEVAQTSDKAETGDSLAVLGDRNYEELETAVLKCLTSVSYDIRCKMLKQLSTLVGEGECGLESMHGDQNQTCTCVNGKQMSKSSVSKLLKSAKLQNQLFNMIGYERQEECQLQLLGLLEKLMASGLQLAATEKVLMDNFERLKTQCHSDTLIASMIMFAGSALKYFKQTACQKRYMSDTAYSDQYDTMERAVDIFVDVVRGYTCEIETDAEVLLACAKTLLANSDILRSEGERVISKVYQSVVDLLQADDLEVRETAAEIVDSFVSDRKVQTHPYLALRNILDHWTSQSKDKGNIIQTLFDMVLDEKGRPQDFEERLFDRGEINTYWDEVDFLKMIDCMLSKCIGSPRDRQCYSEFKNFQENLTELFARLKKLQDSTSSSPVPLRDVFLNTQQYQQQVLTTFQSLLVCKHAKVMNAQCQGHCGAIIESELAQCKETLESSAWISLLHDFINGNAYSN